MRETKHILLPCLISMLMAASCAPPSNGPIFDDPAANHPIAVEPSYQALKIDASAKGIAPSDMSRLEAFVRDYEAHGDGKIAVNVPAGAEADGEAAVIAGRIGEMGVSRDRILIASHDAQPGDDRAELNYVSYRASTGPCGDWSENLAYTMDNRTAANLGCAVQHNVAAEVADPRDLLEPRPASGADANRGDAVITNYEQGKPTSAIKTPDQSGAISDVGR
ncbi:MAG: CpaD family pilus assembly protein [Rhizomicrobium sp.]